jgi:hypothetical protein
MKFPSLHLLADIRPLSQLHTVSWKTPSQENLQPDSCNSTTATGESEIFAINCGNSTPGHLADKLLASHASNGNQKIEQEETEATESVCKKPSELNFLLFRLWLASALSILV